MSRIAKAALLIAVTGAAISTGTGVAAANDGGGGAKAAAVGSPGFLSGNVIQVPISIPINACGNTLNLLAILNSAGGNNCANVNSHNHREQHSYSGHHEGYRDNGHNGYHDNKDYGSRRR
ncbi:chaplin [Streptomyces pathocidini]|uniref:Chaplin n=1 Tax=Streptomyces pathocidini TaxID=1650571 RepID=A0ABW7UU17_9ACTN|nr:chaplin [Streptomyces pathocidini]